MRNEKGSDELLAEVGDFEKVGEGVLLERLRNAIEEGKLAAIRQAVNEPGRQYPSLDTAPD